MKQINCPVPFRDLKEQSVIFYNIKLDSVTVMILLLFSLTTAQRNPQIHQKSLSAKCSFIFSEAYGIFISLLISNNKYFLIKLYSASHQKHIVSWWECKESLWHSQCISAPLIIISKLINAAWNCWVVLHWDTVPFDHSLDSCCVCCLSVTHFARSDLSLLHSHTRCAAVTVVGLKLCRDIRIGRDLRNGLKFSDVSKHTDFVLFFELP